MNRCGEYLTSGYSYLPGQAALLYHTIEMKIITHSLLLLIVLGEFLMAGDRPAGVPQQTRSAVLASNGMVATSQPLAAQAGLRILQQGGNAIDAAVATAAVLNVVEPMSTGIGGDMFAIVYLAKTGELAGLNGSGRSGYAASIDFFTRQGMKAIPTTGVHSVSVPGAVDGWETLLKKYGTMSLAQVLQPAIDYAAKGFPVSEIIAASWEQSRRGAAGATHSRWSKEPWAKAHRRPRPNADRASPVPGRPVLMWPCEASRFGAPSSS